VKATNTERLTLRHCLQSRGASGWAAAVVNVELGLTLLDDLDQLRECLRLADDPLRDQRRHLVHRVQFEMVEDDEPELAALRTLIARIAAALSEPKEPTP
jgi:hypothetical protein